MQKLINYKGFEETLQLIEEQYKVLEEAKTQIEEYSNYIKSENFDSSEEGTFDERVTKIQSVYEKFDEIIEKRSKLTTATEKLKRNTEEILNKTKEILEFSGEQDEIDDIHDAIVDKFVELEKEKFDAKIAEIEKKKKCSIPKELRDVASEEELKQLKKWTGMKIGEIIFDTNKDDWGRYSCQFDNIVQNRKDLVLFVHSENDVHFGAFVHACIRGHDWVKKTSDDDKSFTFSFYENTPRKFSIIPDAENVMHLPYSSDPILFGIGSNDFNVNKRGCDSVLARQQQGNASYYYQGITHPFTGCSGNYFTHKRVVVIQMK